MFTLFEMLKNKLHQQAEKYLNSYFSRKRLARSYVIQLLKF